MGTTGAVDEDVPSDSCMTGMPMSSSRCSPEVSMGPVSGPGPGSGDHQPAVNGG